MSGGLVARTPAGVAEDLVALILARTGVVRVLLDGPGSDRVASAMIEPLRVAGRQPLPVHGRDFLRPAGERFEHGRQDPDAMRTSWLDAPALQREVLLACVADPPTWLPALWDAVAERSARRRREPVPPQAVVLLDGVLMLGRGLPAELTVHVAQSDRALQRRGLAQWQRAAYADYDRLVHPGERCDVLVRAEDAERPAVLVRPSAVGPLRPVDPAVSR